ncbi:aldose 1-epimerase family protein [Microbacterium sp. RD1]|uniref:aldose 1-epimerase family protein n=1 Tax=Microbacterium sp. RD1 TaxID=3457313 RepID=UPI003FA55CBB
MVRTPLSGTQHALRAGNATAVIAGVGASLRSLTHGGRDLVASFGADEVRPAYRGATLAPWPNRVVDGRYAFGGVAYELPLTEPRRGHALHGLLAWTEYAAIDKGPSHVTLAATIEAQTGYPWRVAVETTYELSSEGLRQVVRARNDSETAAPWGTGPHPYLLGGSGPLDEWTLHLPAAQVLEVTPDRLIPTVLAPVHSDPTRFDFREPRRLGAVEIDHAFTDLTRDADGFATVVVTDAAGCGAAIAFDDACAWVQVHTADQPDGPASPLHRAGLAVEPMTCAPDAFRGEQSAYDPGLITLEPGAETVASWEIRPVG